MGIRGHQGHLGDSLELLDDSPLTLFHLQIILESIEWQCIIILSTSTEAAMAAIAVGRAGVIGRGTHREVGSVLGFSKMPPLLESASQTDQHTPPRLTNTRLDAAPTCTNSNRGRLLDDLVDRETNMHSNRREISPHLLLCKDTANYRQQMSSGGRHRRRQNAP